MIASALEPKLLPAASSRTGNTNSGAVPGRGNSQCVISPANVSYDSDRDPPPSVRAENLGSKNASVAGMLISRAPACAGKVSRRGKTQSCNRVGNSSNALSMKRVRAPVIVRHGSEPLSYSAKWRVWTTPLPRSRGALLGQNALANGPPRQAQEQEPSGRPVRPSNSENLH
jgi:hypothetical protein